jgi:hypothetical protein
LSNSGVLKGYLTAYSGGLILASTTGPLTLNNTAYNVLIGTTTDSGYKLDVVGTFRATGEAAFSASVKATTGFNSFTDTIGVANVTWVTIYTIPASQAAEGVYNVYAHYNDDSGGMAFTQILADRTHLREINNSDGATVLIQLSGRNIQVQHSYGTTVNIDWSILIQKLR